MEHEPAAGDAREPRSYPPHYKERLSHAYSPVAASRLPQARLADPQERFRRRVNPPLVSYRTYQWPDSVKPMPPTSMPTNWLRVRYPTSMLTATRGAPAKLNSAPPKN